MSAVRNAVVEAQASIPAGNVILCRVYDYIGRFVAYPSEHARIGHVLWIAHTHLMERWDSTPRIAFLSPEPGSGKSRALEVSAPLVPNPVHAVNTSPAYLFRKVGVEDGKPTILFDEIDTVFGPRAKENEEIRGLLNAGHRKGAVAGRCVVHGKQVLTEEIPAYAAVALAGLGGLPDTILSRSVVIRMRRRAPNEKVEQYRQRLHEPEGKAIGDDLAAWCSTVAERIVWPDIPPEVQDRDADLWEALLAVADAAGGDWPQRARQAAVSLVSESKASSPSLGVLLLRDLRDTFDGADAMFTETILERLHKIEESPWSDLRGKPLDSRGLSNRLRQYGVKPKQVRVGNATAKGYAREDLHDPWTRYLPPIESGFASRQRETSETGETSQAGRGLEGLGFVPDDLKHGQLSETLGIRNGENVSDVSLVSHRPEANLDGGDQVEAFDL